MQRLIKLVTAFSSTKLVFLNNDANNTVYVAAHDIPLAQENTMTKLQSGKHNDKSTTTTNMPQPNRKKMNVFTRLRNSFSQDAITKYTNQMITAYNTRCQNHLKELTDTDRNDELIKVLVFDVVNNGESSIENKLRKMYDAMDGLIKRENFVTSEQNLLLDLQNIIKPVLELSEFIQKNVMENRGNNLEKFPYVSIESLIERILALQDIDLKFLHALQDKDPEFKQILTKYREDIPSQVLVNESATASPSASPVQVGQQADRSPLLQNRGQQAIQKSARSSLNSALKREIYQPNQENQRDRMTMAHIIVMRNSNVNDNNKQPVPNRQPVPVPVEVVRSRNSYQVYANQLRFRADKLISDFNNANGKLFKSYQPSAATPVPIITGRAFHIWFNEMQMINQELVILTTNIRQGASSRTMAIEKIDLFHDASTCLARIVNGIARFCKSYSGIGVNQNLHLTILSQSINGLVRSINTEYNQFLNLTKNVSD